MMLAAIRRVLQQKSFLIGVLFGSIISCTIFYQFKTQCECRHGKLSPMQNQATTIRSNSQIGNNFNKTYNSTSMDYKQYSDQYNFDQLGIKLKASTADILSTSTMEYDQVKEYKESSAEDVRILCMVLTSPKTHKSKAIHVKKTWGQRCNVLLFVTTANDEPELEPIINVNQYVKEGRGHLWAKVRHGFKEVYNKYIDTADWFLKADDDTYVILENLRHFLKPFDPNSDHYFGAVFHPRWSKFDYMSGGAGYVLSRESVVKLVEEAMDNKTLCRPDTVPKSKLSEDLEMGRCMKNLNISADDSRDLLGKSRFFPFTPTTHMNIKNMKTHKWWWGYTKYSQVDGLDCCSDTAIAFHYVDPKKMYLFEYLLYHLHPIGHSNKAWRT